MREIVTEHGGYEVREYEIDITQEMRDQALAFAAKIKIDDNQFSRLLPAELRDSTDDNITILKTEILRTYAGKLGELAFLSLLTEKGKNCNTEGMFDIYEGKDNTDEFDFKTSNGQFVDVKTGYRNNHSRLLVNKQQFVNHPKDIYVGVKLNDIPEDNRLAVCDIVETAVIKGYAEKTYLDGLSYRNYGESLAKGLHYDRLLAIDRLLALF